MRTFAIGWLLAFGLMGLTTLGLGSVLGGSVQPGPSPTPVLAEDSQTAPFSQGEAVDLVAGRFGPGATGERYRRELKQAARVTYHSPRHWTVRWDAASWTAHGPGRYVEPDNDAARQREAEAAGSS